MNKLISILILVTLAAVTSNAQTPFYKLDQLNPNNYQTLPDLAKVERRSPLSPAERNKITVAQLKGYSQEQLDQIYARIPSGYIPMGDFRGTVLVKHALIHDEASKVLETITSKGFLGLFATLVTSRLCKDKDTLECMGEMLWKGKRFYQRNQFGEVQLRNALDWTAQMLPLLDKNGLGALKGPISRAPREDFGGQSKFMSFPAGVYCGLSLYDTRRESIIIDYAYGDDFKPFTPEFDGLVGRNGSWVRDEIRMIRPGLYLGRAYVDRVFLVNFVLESAGPVQQTRQPSGILSDLVDKIKGPPKKVGEAVIDKITGQGPGQNNGPVSWENECWATDSWQ
jgi:hypothetical protein